MIIEINNKDEIIKNNSRILVLSLPEGKKKYLAKYVLNKLLNDGTISRGQPIVVPTSGKMGLALAELYDMGNNSVFCVTSRAMPEYRRKIQLLSKGDVFEINSDGTLNMQKQRHYAFEKAQKIGGFYLDQYLLNEQEECYVQLCKEVLPAELPIDCYIENVATGGTFLGFYRELSERNPKCAFFVTKLPSQTNEFFEGIPFLKKTKYEILDYTPCFTNDIDIIDVLKNKGLTKRITFAHTALQMAVQWANKNDNKTILVFVGD